MLQAGADVTPTYQQLDQDLAQACTSCLQLHNHQCIGRSVTVATARQPPQCLYIDETQQS